MSRGIRENMDRRGARGMRSLGSPWRPSPLSNRSWHFLQTFEGAIDRWGVGIEVDRERGGGDKEEGMGRGWNDRTKSVRILSHKNAGSGRPKQGHDKH